MSGWRRRQGLRQARRASNRRPPGQAANDGCLGPSVGGALFRLIRSPVACYDDEVEVVAQSFDDEDHVLLRAANSTASETNAISGRSRSLDAGVISNVFHAGTI